MKINSYLFFLLILFGVRITNGQSTCATATPVSSAPASQTVTAYTPTEKWYFFAFDAANTILTLKSKAGGNTRMNSIEAFEGTCSGLTPIGLDTMYNSSDTLAVLRMPVNPHPSNIYIKVSATASQEAGAKDFALSLVVDTGLYIQGWDIDEGCIRTTYTGFPDNGCQTIFVCIGDTVRYLGETTGSANGLTAVWTFQGGSPSTGSAPLDAANIFYSVYNTAGTFLTSYTVNGMTSLPVTVVVRNPPTFNSLTAAQDTVDCDEQNCYSFVLDTNTTSPVTIQWDWGNGEICGTLPNMTFCNTQACNTFGIGGTYWSVVTVTLDTLPGCSFKDSIKTVVRPCCVVDDSITQITNDTLNYNLVDSLIQLNGTVIITGNRSWTRSKVWLGPNAKIILAPNSTLRIITTHVLAACEYMWDFIEVPQGDTILIERRSLIEDGIFGVMSTGGGVIKIRGSFFNRNHTAVTFAKTNNANPASFINSTAFTSLNFANSTQGTNVNIYMQALAVAYNANPYQFAKDTLYAPHGSEYAYLGVRIDRNQNATPLVIGDVNSKNTFDRLKYGIYSTSSNIKISGNRFQSINNPQNLACNTVVNKTPCIECEIGTGICITGGKLPTSSAQVGEYLNGNGNYANIFDSLRIGINVVNYSNLKAIKNDINNATYGILTLGNKSRVVSISQNRVRRFFIGIGLKDNTSSFMRIDSNLVNTNGVPLVPNLIFPPTGIYVADVIASSSATLNIRNNTIRSTQAGIFLAGVEYSVAEISDANSILWQGNSYPAPNVYRGVVLVNSRGVRVDGNSIGTQGIPPANKGVIGSRLRGVSIENSPNTTVSHNTLSNLGVGVYGSNQSFASTLGCNILNRNFNDFMFTGTSGSCNIGSQVLNGVTPAPTGNTFITYSGAGFDLTGQIFPTINWYYPTGGYSPTNGLGGSSLFGNTPTASTNPSSCTFLPNLRTAPQARQAEAGEPLGSLPLFSASAEEVYHYKQRVHHALKRNQNWLNLSTPQDAMYQSFFYDMQNRNVGKFANVDADLENGNINAAVLLNNAIADSGTIETNLKTVNTIYTNSFAAGRFILTSSEKNILMGIALQSPATAGIEAVYRSRAMLDIYIDDDMPVNGGQRLANETEETEPFEGNVELNVYPNPANDFVTVEKEDESAGLFILTDVVGKIVYTTQFTSNISKINITSSELSNGVYFYNYLINGEKRKSGKLIINH